MGTYEPPTISERTGRARVALDSYMGMPMVSEDQAEALGDLLTDLMHLADLEGIDFAEVINRAAWNHEAETDSDGGVNPASKDPDPIYTVCHYCEDQGRGEVQVLLSWDPERQSFYGICDCGETFSEIPEDRCRSCGEPMEDIEVRNRECKNCADKGAALKAQ